MAIVFTPQDAHTIINLVQQQATGEINQTVTDTSSFVSAGQTILTTGMENVFNALSYVFNRLIVASRRYRSNLYLMDAENTGEFSALVRKVSYYSTGALPAGNLNTNLYKNLAEGFTSGENWGGTPPAPQSTKSQWEQHRKPVLQMNFYSTNVWQDCITMDEEAVKASFKDETEFIKFFEGYLQEHQNDLEQQREDWNRLCLLNKVASVYAMSADMPGSAVDLVALYNSENNTTLTGAQLRTTYKKEFLAFFVARFKEFLSYLPERSTMYHWSVPKTIDGVTYNILRHTPLEDVHVYMYDRFFKDSESLVLPEIFHDNLLDIKTQYQPVTFWQSIDDRASINCIPSITNTVTGEQEPAGSAVVIPYVLALITDRDGLMTNFELDRADTTTLEARKHYRNTWNTYIKGCYSDNTEKAILLYMAS